MLEVVVVCRLHQVMVGGVGVILWKRFGNSQRDTVSKDGQEDEDIKGSEGSVEEEERRGAKARLRVRLKDTSTPRWRARLS